MTDKKALRAEAALRRQAVHGVVDIGDATARLDRVLEGLPSPVAFFWPMRSEIDPRPAMALAARRGPVCLPVTHGKGPLTFRAWAPGMVLARDGFGTEFPREGPDMRPETLVVPLLAFDRRCHRLGYGAGHYDRTLAALRGEGAVTAIGFAYSAQEVAHLPDEPWDVPLEAVVTEAETIYP